MNKTNLIVLAVAIVYIVLVLPKVSTTTEVKESKKEYDGELPTTKDNMKFKVGYTI